MSLILSGRYKVMKRLCGNQDSVILGLSEPKFMVDTWSLSVYYRDLKQKEWILYPPILLIYVLKYTVWTGVRNVCRSWLMSPRSNNMVNGVDSERLGGQEKLETSSPKSTGV